MTRTLDRLISFDEKSKNYPIRTLLPDKPPRSYTWKHVQLDQGSEGACVGFACTMESAARPVPIFGDPRSWPPGRDVTELNDRARQVYYRARQLDYWEGEDYEGTSVIAGVKAGLELGWWQEYRWALGPGPEAAAQDVIMSVGYRGPVIMGTWWYESMFNPNADGYLDLQGSPAGGHAWLVTAYSKKRDAIWTPNSWGGYGQGWITRANLVRLLAEDGEACIPITRKKPVNV